MEKKVFLIATADDSRRKDFERRISSHVSSTTIYTASDGQTALSKAVNVPPSALITDLHLPKLEAVKLVEAILKEKTLDSTGIIIASPPPEKELFVDQVVTGRVQFLLNEKDEVEFKKAIFKALNYSSHHEKAEFHLRFLAAGELLIREGDKADFVYIVKSGRLQAYKDTGANPVVLGPIEEGEFAGEMAFINGEPRSASVSALTDCELIEVPIGTFENLLYSRPAWSRALMRTLSKRIKKANQVKIAQS